MDVRELEMHFPSVKCRRTTEKKKKKKATEICISQNRISRVVQLLRENMKYPRIAWETIN